MEPGETIVPETMCMIRLLIPAVLLAAALVTAGCTATPYHNPFVTVTSADISDITPVRVGSFDVYTIHFRVQNPTNTSFSNVSVGIQLDPAATYCHTQVYNISFPVLGAYENHTEQTSFSEIGDLSCLYTYRYVVTSDPLA